MSLSLIDLNKSQKDKKLTGIIEEHYENGELKKILSEKNISFKD